LRTRSSAVQTVPTPAGHAHGVERRQHLLEGKVVGGQGGGGEEGEDEDGAHDKYRTRRHTVV
jgi:hypothetical protein